MILLWDTDSGLAQLDKYLHSNDTHVVAGALLGIGIVTCGVKSDCDPVSAPLSLATLGPSHPAYSYVPNILTFLPGVCYSHGVYWQGRLKHSYWSNIGSWNCVCWFPERRGGDWFL